jgi:hypothetical protein
MAILAPTTRVAETRGDREIMNTGLAAVIVGVAIAGIVAAIGIPIARLRGRPVGSGWEAETFGSPPPTGPSGGAGTVGPVGRASRLPPRYTFAALNPLALAFTLLGTVVTLAGVFLPANRGVHGYHLKSNALIDHGQTWTVVIVGLYNIGLLVFLYRRHLRPTLVRVIWAPLLTLLAAGSLLGGSTLHPVAADGTPVITVALHGAAGIGVFVVFAGVVVQIIGLITLSVTARPLQPETPPAYP